MTSQQLAGLAGVALALVFAYLPGVKQWFDGKSAEWKALTIGIAIVAVGVAAFLLNCVQVVTLQMACTREGVGDLLTTIIAALVASQSTYLIGVKPFQTKA